MRFWPRKTIEEHWIKYYFGSHYIAFHRKYQYPSKAKKKSVEVSCKMISLEPYLLPEDKKQMRDYFNACLRDEQYEENNNKEAKSSGYDF